MAREHGVKGTVQLLLVLGLAICLLVVSSSAFSFSQQNRLHVLPAKVKKRGNMDLAFMQVYQLCDRDRSGHFSAREFRCLNDMLRLLIGVRK